MKEVKLTGTKEWAAKTVNIQYGCENNCEYCYARRMASRFNRIAPQGWDHPIPKTKRPPLPKDTNVMFPSTHDITPANLKTCIQCINVLLGNNNRVLIVGKPRIECIKAICDNNAIFNNKTRVEFRFTLGTIDDRVRQLWEPNAPTIEERVASVKEAIRCGHNVSISCEPLLDVDCAVVDYFKDWEEISEIWIGAMNYVKDAPDLDYEMIYAWYKDNPKIKWKESFRKHLKGERLS